MKKFLEWLKNIHSSGTSESAKRLYGALGYVCAIVYIGIWRHDLIEMLLIVSATLLGLETIFNSFIKNRK